VIRGWDNDYEDKAMMDDMSLGSSTLLHRPELDLMMRLDFSDSLDSHDNDAKW
jgi:hypothetical protein